MFCNSIYSQPPVSLFVKVNFFHVFVELVSVSCLKGAIVHDATEDDVRMLGFLVVEECLCCFGRIITELTFERFVIRMSAKMAGESIFANRTIITELTFEGFVF